MWTLLFLLMAAETDAGVVWANRTENAAVRTREAAATLARTAREVSQSGRIGALAPLSSDVDELVRRADMLVDITGEPPPEEPPPAER